MRLIIALQLLISFSAASGAQSVILKNQDLFTIPEMDSLNLPAPSPLRENSARQNWLNAASKYSDKNFSPRAPQRIDAGPNYAVMLQGFHWYADDYWYHPARGWWGELADRAGEIANAGFGIIWFPPASVGSYYPKEWYNLQSQWGSEKYLREAVKAMKSRGIIVLADVVLNHRNGTSNWADFKNPDWPTSVIVQDDEWAGIPSEPNYGKSPNYDQGQGDWGCRDLDHRNPLVQQDTKIFMRWLKNDIGFDGWRYDMVKGYPAYYVKDYNYASSPIFTVGEVYDGNRQVVTDWIDGTDDSQGKKNASSAFDFPTKFNLISAIENERYEMLNDNGRPSGLIGWWPVKAVTFVENHDTSPRDPNFIKNASQEYRIQRMMGYAYILTHPGVPCVFWPHFFDWGQDYRNAVVKLIQLRKKAGVSSVSPVKILAAQNGLYAALITGDNYYLVLKLGKNWGWEPGQGWTLETSGERYAVWSQPVSK